MVAAMCLYSEMTPIYGKDSKVPSETKGADSSPGKASRSSQVQMSARRLSFKKRKPTRVLYPAQVRKYLPRQETDKAKKWLFILGAIVFFQIFLEDDDYEVCKTLVGHDSIAVKFPSHANTSIDSGTLSDGHFSVRVPETETLVNSTILNFSRSMYYDLRND